MGLAGVGGAGYEWVANLYSSRMETALAERLLNVVDRPDRLIYG